MGDEYQPHWESLSENQPLYCEMSQGFDKKIRVHSLFTMKNIGSGGHVMDVRWDMIWFSP